jgi:CheY-like chemotaxis protein
VPNELAGRCVIVAAADADVRRELGRRLSGHGLAVHVADDIEKTFSLLRSVRADIVLLDLALPSYPQLSHLLRHSRVVLMAPSSAVELARLLVSAGAVDFLVKPVDPIQAERTVLWHLSKSAAPPPALPRPTATRRSEPQRVSAAAWPALSLALAFGALLLVVAIAVRLLGIGGPSEAEYIQSASRPPGQRKAPAAASREAERKPDPQFSIQPPPLPSTDGLLSGTTDSHPH